MVENKIYLLMSSGFLLGQYRSYVEGEGYNVIKTASTVDEALELAATLAALDSCVALVHAEEEFLCVEESPHPGDHFTWKICKTIDSYRTNKKPLILAAYNVSPVKVADKNAPARDPGRVFATLAAMYN